MQMFFVNMIFWFFHYAIFEQLLLSIALLAAGIYNVSLNQEIYLFKSNFQFQIVKNEKQKKNIVKVTILLTCIVVNMGLDTNLRQKVDYSRFYNVWEIVVAF